MAHVLLVRCCAMIGKVWLGFLLLAVSCRPNEAQKPDRVHEARQVQGTGEAVQSHELGRPVSSAEPHPSPHPAPHAALERDLAVDGFEPALVSWPEHRDPLPVLVVAHGAGGRAEHHERAWRTLLSEPHAIVAFRGRPLRANDPEGGYYYPNHHELNDELVAVVGAVRTHPALSDHLAPFPWTYAGYSQGATMGALALVDHGEWFSRLVLIEGGTQGWTLARSGRLVDARSGAAAPAIAWVCGTKGCTQGAQQAARTAERAGLRTRVFVAPGAGHTYLGAVQSQVHAAWSWLYSSEAAW